MDEFYKSTMYPTIVNIQEKLKQQLFNGYPSLCIQFDTANFLKGAPLDQMNYVKAGVDASKEADRGMAPLGFRIIEHGVYAMPFLVNPTAALKSGCQLRDIELLCRLIPYAYAHNPSRVRPFVEVRHAWYFQHRNRLGSASDFAVIDSLTPNKADPSEPSTSWADYNYDGVDVLKKAQHLFAGKFEHFGDLCDEVFVNQVFPRDA
jgi:hypothetical protein